MSFGGDCLVNKINQQIAALQGSTYESSQLAGSVRSALEKSVYSVATINDLPPAACNEGRFIYVEACRSFRYSDGYDWLMNACSVFGNVNQVNQLWSWGCNTCGALGDGTTSSRSSPVTIVGNNSTWCQISSSSLISAAIKTDGTLWTWGANSAGQLGDGTTVNRCSPGTIAGGGINWCQISTGGSMIGAIKIDGTLWTWGDNTTGRLGDGTTVSRCSPGTVAGGGTNWCQVSSFNLGAAIKTDGTLWTWGANNFGQLGDGTTVSRSSPGTTAGCGTNWCKISINNNPIAIKCDGTLWTWGCNATGALGDGTTVSRSSPGTVWGSYITWTRIFSGELAALGHVSAIKNDGTLWTWGCNGQGRLGDGTVLNRCSPGTVAGGGTNWCQVTAGRDHMAAIKTNGTLWTWGCGGAGTLGNGGLTSRSSPGTVAGVSACGGTTWCQVVGGYRQVIAIKTRGF